MSRAAQVDAHELLTGGVSRQRGRLVLSSGKGLHSYGFRLGEETYVVTFVIAGLPFVAFATWRYRSTKPQRPPTSPTPVTAGQVAA